MPSVVRALMLERLLIIMSRDTDKLRDIRGQLLADLFSIWRYDGDNKKNDKY